MTIKQYLSKIFILIFVVTIFSCATTDSQKISSGLSKKAWNLVESAVFEVVVKKPVKDSLTYDKELNWDLVPYSIRTDSYYSIGTAFAISKTELVTAFHVIELEKESTIFDKYYIRDSKGNLFEIDLVFKASKEKDFVVFSVKNKTFDKFFEFEKSFSIGSQVFSIGNALGEGIIVRNGLVLGTLPEEDSGRWNLLKSSADGNPGNSGGPLVTSAGKVVGVITGLKDNILYSLPADVLLETPSDTLHFRTKLSYVHILLANRITKTSETTIPLPDTYTAIKKKLADWFDSDYIGTMTELFNAAPEYLYGPNNSYFLNSSLNTVFPQVAYVDKNSDEWRLSDLKVDNFSLPDDGLLMKATISDFSFLKINRPITSDIIQLNSDPQFFMDLILKGLNLERTLSGAEKYRILSFGEPVSVSEYKDRMGRVWLTCSWIIEFEDKVIIMYILPLPNGPAALMTIQSTAEYKIYDWDLKAICNLLHAAYKADFNEWNNFFEIGKWIPEFFSDFSFIWDEAENEISFQYPAFSINANANIFDWIPTSSLFLCPSYYMENGEIRYGIRKVILQRDIRGRDYIVFYKNIKPAEKLGAKAAEAWDSIVKEKYPFDEKAIISGRDNSGSIGTILMQKNPLPDVRYSLYLTMEDPLSEEDLTTRFNILKEGIFIEY
ncbi:MAG: serine protease [Spirochaetaceae bacterium]|nr:serine protease [Spirochaetaceae bacterium]